MLPNGQKIIVKPGAKIYVGKTAKTMRPIGVVKDPVILEDSYLKQSEIAEDCCRDITQQREQQIIQKLAEAGYVFSSMEELAKFAITRCRHLISMGDLHHLFVDDQLICQWYERISTGIVANNNIVRFEFIVG